MEYIIEVDRLTKRYGELTAVNNVTLGIPEGICFGLLGPNGAGKTTMIEIMEGIREQTGGEVRYRGKPLGEDYHDRVGIQFQQTALQEYITVRETLETFGKLYSRRRDFDELVEMCNLEELLDKDNQKLSGGQRQRMLLALALVNDPDLIFLDEPTTGLDPQARRNFWNLIKGITDDQRTVILTTHYMEEAQLLSDQIAIMDHGDIIAKGEPQQLLDNHFKGVFVRLPQPTSGARLPEGTRYYDEYVDIQTGAVDQTVKDLLSAGHSLDGLSIHRPNLDDLFLELTGTSLRS